MKTKRMMAYFIDHLILSIISNIIVSFLVFLSINPNDTGIGVIPFLVIIACVAPAFTSAYLLFWSIVGIFEGNIAYMYELNPYILTILAIIIVQTILLSIYETLTNGLTIGRKGERLKLINENGKHTIVKIIIRNFIKSFGKYMFYIPFISLIFSKDNKTIYDKILKTRVIDTYSKK